MQSTNKYNVLFLICFVKMCRVAIIGINNNYKLYLVYECIGTAQYSIFINNIFQLTGDCLLMDRITEIMCCHKF